MDNNQNVGQNSTNNVVPMPAQPNNVNPTPMPSTNQNVAVTPVVNSASQVQNVQTVNQAQPSIQPQAVQQSNQPQSPVQVASTPVNNSAPSQLAQTPVNVQPQVSTQSIPNMDNGELTVVKVRKKKTSNVILIIIIILLVVFVFNIEKVIEYYDNYQATGSITIPEDKPTDNLTGGYILIDDNSSSIKVENIRFYNFSKNSDTSISFNYDPNKEYKDPSSLGIYIELYNYDKELLYKELFDTKETIEMGKIKTYTMIVDNNVYIDSHYALVKTYSTKESSSKESMICNYVEGDIVYKYTYNFVNNGLDNYEVNIEEYVDDTKEPTLKAKYEELSEELGATYENNILSFKVDLNKEIVGFTPIYLKNTTKYVIKSKEELKKWTCNNG